MSKNKELLKHKMTRMHDSMKDEIQASANKYNKGVFDRELRKLIKIGLKNRKMAILDVTQQSEQLANFCKKISKQEDCPAEFQEIVNKEFWNLI